ncbi:MAG: hypothetical protein V3V62_06440 [bacterium]
MADPVAIGASASGVGARPSSAATGRDVAQKFPISRDNIIRGLEGSTQLPPKPGLVISTLEAIAIEPFQSNKGLPGRGAVVDFLA